MYLQLLHMISGTKPVTVHELSQCLLVGVSVRSCYNCANSHLLQQAKQKVGVAIILISIYILIRTYILVSKSV